MHACMVNERLAVSTLYRFGVRGRGRGYLGVRGRG